MSSRAQSRPVPPPFPHARDAGGTAGMAAESASVTGEALASLVREAVRAELRDLLTDESVRRDLRYDLSRRRRADRLAFAAQLLAQAMPPSPALRPAVEDRPRADAAARRYRFVQAAARRPRPLS